jgi:hypothetical protein
MAVGFYLVLGGRLDHSALLAAALQNVRALKCAAKEPNTPFIE